MHLRPSGGIGWHAVRCYTRNGKASVHCCGVLRVLARRFLHCRWSRRQRACSQSSSSSTTSTTSCAHTRRASAERGRFSDSTHGLLARYSIVSQPIDDPSAICWRVRLGGGAGDLGTAALGVAIGRRLALDSQGGDRLGPYRRFPARTPTLCHAAALPRTLRCCLHGTAFKARFDVFSALAPEVGGGQSAMPESVHAVRWS